MTSIGWLLFIPLRLIQELLANRHPLVTLYRSKLGRVFSHEVASEIVIVEFL